MDTLELGLEGKVAIVTGASEGLGRATAEKLARCGAKVGMAARRPDVLEAAAQAIQKATGGEVLALPTDVTKADQVEKFVAAVIGRWGGVDVLLNNAGTSSAAGFEGVDEAAWQYDWDSKVMGAIRFCRRVIPSMKARGGGAIVNVTTIGGKSPNPKSLPTSVTRAAGINLTKSLAHEYAADQIRVNTICLGVVKSAQWTRRFKGSDLDAFYAEMAKTRRVPLGRLGEAEEFADLVAFLVSARARFITGASINFDGGASAAV
jgi:NAD(P)-dependent dehydrogenase (short-subunit alcohol dehydrogenase family)